MDTIVTTTYDIFNRKIFSLPKIALLPMVMAKQPMMIAQIFPIIFATDWLKGKAISYMTNRIEELEKDVQELNAVRSKVEQFDMKNSELLQRAGPGAIDFTKRRWQDMTVKIQMKMVVSSLVTRTKGFFSFIQRNFVFSVLVDCALAELMAAGKLVAAEIFVFSRAIEDFIDMVLMRSRSEAELARMMTQIDNLKELSEVWDAAEQRNLLPCNLGTKNHGDDSSEPLVVFKNLLYSRGTAVVQIKHIELPAGVYALTGGNGSGKSTLFRVIMSCDTNDRPIDIPPSILLSMPAEEILAEGNVIEGESSHGVIDEEVVKVTDSLSKTDRLLSSEDIASQFSISMPSSSVVEISQTFYWPLYSKPIDWIYQHSSAETITEKQMQDRRQRVAELLYSLEFSQSLESEEDIAGNYSVTDSRELSEEEPDDNGIVASSTSGDIIARIMDELEEEKEDWFNDLSGGQKSKVELVRKVFLMDECPHVLLIDETMAPLDPRSKSLVMAKIKSFCAGSVVIVIYHTDVGRDKESEESGEVIECVPSNDFFDGNIHVEDKMMHLRPVC
jgi:energy-coupling factor transporter ATP-binding protein EcfA2